MSRPTRKDPDLNVVSDHDKAFLDEHGYVVIHDAVPRSYLNAVVDALWKFLGMDRNDPDDWYRPPHRHSGMVEMYHHQTLWDTRQHPRIHHIFSQLLGREDLWVSIDRINMKPPARPDHPEYDGRGGLHWDLDVRCKPLPTMYQGVLCLAETPAGGGGFRCSPGWHRRVAAWVDAQPADLQFRGDLSKIAPETLTGEKQIPGLAGDLIIWHGGLPHGNSRNTSDHPRLAQYIMMTPAQFEDRTLRQNRIDSWRFRTAPTYLGSAFPGDPRQLEQHHQKTARLTHLGRKLLGLEPW